MKSFFFPAGVEYIRGCPYSANFGQGTWTDEKWSSKFGSPENQPDTLISLGKAPVSCCNDNGECQRLLSSEDRGWFDSIVNTVTNVVDDIVDEVEDVVDSVGEVVEEWSEAVEDFFSTASSGDCFPYDATFSEAEEICSALGLRMCRSDEINSGNCCGVGCSFDRHYTWVNNSKYITD